MLSFASRADFEQALQRLTEPDEQARAAAAARQSQLTKPAGSLGRLEALALFMAGWSQDTVPRCDKAHVAVFAGNHGIAAQGVSAFPPSVTAEMVRNFERGGAAINALAQAAGMALRVVALDLDRPTADFTTDAAMSEAELLEALSAGAAVVEPGLDLLALGEMGIANSAAAAAICARTYGERGRDWAGPGTGLDDAGVRHKAAVIDRALDRHADAPADAFETLRRVGGREIAAIAGAVLAARHRRVPVLLDGFICCAAVAPLAADNPAILGHCLAGHVSAEPGHHRLLARFGLEPLLALDMRLGEGSGAAVAATLVRAAVAAHNGMATFAEAGVSGAA